MTELWISMVSTLEHITCACPTFQIVFEGWTQEEPKQVLWRKQTPSSNTHATRPSHFWFWNPTTPTQNATHWSSQLTALESLTKLFMDMKDELYHNQTLDEGSIYECIFTSQFCFCYFEARSTFARGWSFTFTLRPKKLIGTHTFSQLYRKVPAICACAYR